LAVKSTSIPATKIAAAPAKTGNGKAVQRKVLPGLFAPSMIQRKEQPGSWVHANSQKPVNSRALVQPKVKVHASDDHYEKEADQVADKVMNSEKAAAPVRVSRISKAAQRKSNNSGATSTIQQKKVGKKYSAGTLESTDSGPPVVNNDTTNHSLDKVLDNQSSRGSPLPTAIRKQMESRMGADFSGVRVHTGNSSHEANTSIGARAFTNGNNIHFAKGEFNPASKSGQRLLAHELAHTMQQGAAPEKKVIGPTPEPGRKIVAKPKFEKKIARIPSPYNNKKNSQKESNDTFTKKVSRKKPARLPAAAFKKQKGRKLNKDPIALPGKEKKKPAPAPKVPVKPQHLLNIKSQHAQIAQLAAKGINFKPFEDKKIADNPLYKVQAQQSKSISENVLSKAAQTAAKIADTVVRVRPRLAQVAAKAIGNVKTNEAVQKEKINTETKTEKSAAKKAMQSASGSIKTKHTKVADEITSSAKTGRTDIDAAKTNNTDSINKAALDQAPIIKDAYVQAQKDFEESGQSVGKLCSQRAAVWSQNYLSTLKYEDDSLLDGPYTDDVKRAKADAATKVGDGYNEGITKAGTDQGAAIHEGMPNDLKKISDAQEEMLKHVNERHETTLKGIDGAEQSGITQADGTQKSMLSSVGTQHKAAQAKLDLTQKMHGQFCEIVSKKQSEQIELQSEQATQSMEEGGAESLEHLHNGFKEYKQLCESMNSPPPAMLQKQLQPIEAGLAQNAPAMAASLQKGMLQSENGFHKSAADTIANTSTTVTEGLTQSKADNGKAIGGLHQLKGAAVTSLEGTLSTNKKTITGSAAQCVTDTNAIKSAYDTTLTNISTDLSSGMKTGSTELKKGLTDTVDHGQGETKSLARTSDEEEKKAADQVEPRWKSALKILLVIVVTLLIALVVGPAVIGFIGAAAGGGAFGAAVGAVVGGAILGAASSAVITVGNNLIDGKTWHEGVGKAMLEGAITGAIGGAFGAAGSGLATKMVGAAAEGIKATMKKFVISQVVDFAGNVTTEYASSKLQNKPFSWTAVAQGQAIGAGVHVSMGGLQSLKNVKGFQGINRFTDNVGKFGDKWGKKATGRPVVTEPQVAPVKPGVEEPKNKGPAATKEEPAITAPKEEPQTTAPKEEPTPATAKEETPATPAPKEEPKAPAPKEEPSAPATKEEPTTTAPKEEPKAPAPKEEPATTAPKEETAATTPKEEPKATAAKEDPAAAPKEETATPAPKEPDAFHDNPYKNELPVTRQKKLAKEWQQIKDMPDGPGKAKAKSAFETKVDAEIEARLSAGDLQAKRKGYPPAPKGYQWRVGADGEPVFLRNPNSGKDQLVFDKENNRFVDPAEIKKPTREVELLPKKTQAELEEIAKGVDPATWDKLPSNTLEHKAARWEQYKAKGKENPLSYEAWSNVYDSGMNNAIRGNKVAGEVHTELGWGKREATVPVGSENRRLDIADLATQRGVEVKAYESGKVDLSPHVEKEIRLDTELQKKMGWTIEWIFRDCVPVPSVKALLDAGGIKIILQKTK